MAPKDRSIFINSKPAKDASCEYAKAIRIPSDSEYLSRKQVRTRGEPTKRSTCGICSVPEQPAIHAKPRGGAATSSEFLSGSRKRPPREKHLPSSFTLHKYRHDSGEWTVRVPRSSLIDRAFLLHACPPSMRFREPKARNARPPNAIRAYVERPMHFPTAMHGCARLRRVWYV